MQQTEDGNIGVGEYHLPAARQQGARGSGARELQLLEQIRQGDEDAFEALYRIYHPRLTRFLTNLVRRPQLVEEVLNDTMMVVWQRAGSFNGASKLSTWIFAIAYRKAMKGLRRQDDPMEDHDAENRESLDDSPEEASAHDRRHNLLLRAVNELSPTHRAVVDLTYFHELDYNEIARILDCPIGTVKTRMFHARRHLKRHLGGEIADWV
jgi:RNA polymerase sigma-70 factor (ECF subfamily)